MAKPKQNPYQVISDLIANAIGSARVFGESRRITNLVASSVQRLMAEMEEDEADALLEHALTCISVDDAGHVPALYTALKAASLSRV